ncbi:enoyl-CoA hydratase/isomerase family protein [Paraburkholderia sediminicola]|uniref:enoyl-CoA hydratase/isomerase family protein n=1 Tax=Paraburkholderia sediminicola TaxID=458836 RepID=UPI0038B744DB
MSSSNGSVVIDKDGHPAGFLETVDELKTIKVHMTDDGIVTIALARPNKLNAFDERMIREMRNVIWKANFDDEVRVVVITGEGRAFCAGRDVAGLDYENNLKTSQYRAYVRANHELFDEIESIEKPVIAAINGICAGGGVEMAIACDFRMAARSATFLLPENQLGVIPASGACSRMIQMIGMGRLKEMIMAVEPVDAESAFRIGLATRLCEDEALMADTMAFARKLLTKAPQAMGMAKHIINACQNVDTETGRMLERLGQSVLIRTEDNQEGMSAFLGKRSPKFQGR